MDPSEFQAKGAGRIVTTPEGYAAFVPAPLPPRISYTGNLVLALSRADAALGELSGVGGELPAPQVLDASFKRQEALCSSRIEGAEVSLSDLYLDQVGAARSSVPREHLREVRACIQTLRFGVEQLRQESLSLEFIKELHEQLLRDEVSGARTPGEFRTSQNWLGPPGVTQATAPYVPPPVEELPEALAAFEEFLQGRHDIPDLLQCAMLHAQFESIHPFVGGNGRLGRLLITLFLIERGRLTRPLLYLSAFLEAHREEYYALLQRVRTHGEWTPWLTFFCEGVRSCAERATRQARALIGHYERDRETVKGHARRLADELFRTPVMTVPEAQRILDVANPTARSAVRQLEARGLLVEWDEKRWPRVYLAKHVLDAVLHPLEDLRRAPGASKGIVVKSETVQAQRPLRRADRLMAEAMDIIDVARAAGAQLRLTGGLAVRRYCTDLDFMDREYSDIDFVGSSDEKKEIHAVFEELGYTENRYVAQATDSGQLQFIKNEALEGMKAEASAAARGVQSTYEPPLVDHIDVFMDVMRMDHDLDVSDRLEIDDYAISPADAFIAKMQIGRINQKDVHDVIALVKDVPLRDVDDETSIDLLYIAEVCARDWGLYRDITANLDIVLAMVGDYGLTEGQQDRVYARLAAIKESVESAGKSLRWRLRATVGERVAWRREIEDTEGTQIIAPEWDWRRDLG
ncbi:MAG: Fic family protein [Actinobacteria bacterium]|nr:Fic family protein [Actinomycetota bacterium]